MRRIAYVCTDPGVPVFGSKGASAHVQAVVRVLVDRGIEVHLVAARTGGPTPGGLESVVVHELPRAPKGNPPERERAAQAADAHVADVLDALAPLDLVYERYALWGRTGTAWARRTGTPSVLEVNAPLVDEQATHRTLVDRKAAEDVASAAVSAADVVVCVSDEVARWARSRSARPARVHVVPNGVDVDRVVPSGRPPTAPDEPLTIGFVGTLKPWHGVERLLEALAVLAQREPTPYRLLLVGDGPEAGALRAQAERLGVKSLVELTGAVEPDAVPPLLHRMDVAVAPYPPIEDFYFSPLKVYEYLAAGLPVIASRVGQLPAVLEEGRLGVLVEPGDVDALAAAVAALRAEPARRAELGGAARAAAVRRHAWTGVVDRILGLLPSRQVAS